MPECLERRVKEHPRTAVTHHFPDFLPHFRTITMYATFPARLFTVTERATVQPGLRISQNCFAFGTKPFRPMPATAVQPYHKLHRIIFFPYLPHFPYFPYFQHPPQPPYLRIFSTFIFSILASSFCTSFSSFFLHLFSASACRFPQKHTKIAKLRTEKHGMADISDLRSEPSCPRIKWRHGARTVFNPIAILSITNALIASAL